MSPNIKNITNIMKALSNENRLKIIMWLMEPKAHFPKQVDGDLVKDGVCLGAFHVKLGISQPTATNYLRILENADLVTSKRIKNWTFYKLNPDGMHLAEALLKDIRESKALLFT